MSPIYQEFYDEDEPDWFPNEGDRQWWRERHEVRPTRVYCVVFHDTSADDHMVMSVWSTQKKAEAAVLFHAKQFGDLERKYTIADFVLDTDPHNIS